MRASSGAIGAGSMFGVVQYLVVQSVTYDLSTRKSRTEPQVYVSQSLRTFTACMISLLKRNDHLVCFVRQYVGLPIQ